MIPVISASKVAGFIGLHAYQPQSEIMYDMLCTNKEVRARIQSIESAEETRPYRKVVNEFLRGPAIAGIVRSSLVTAQATGDLPSAFRDASSQALTAMSLENSEYPPDLRTRLVDEVRGAIAKQRGLANEEKILDTYEVAKNVKVVQRNTKTVTKDFGTFKLTGRCDGYVADQNRIVDSKDRTRLWPKVPVYDEIQLRCYMNLYEATESELIERFPDKTTRHTLYPLADDKWEAIETALRHSTEMLNRAMTDEDELRRVVLANNVLVR